MVGRGSDMELLRMMIKLKFKGTYMRVFVGFGKLHESSKITRISSS